MLNGQYVSVKEVIAKVYRDLNLQEEDRIADMIEWSAEALDHIGAYQQYCRPEPIELCVDCYTTQLPSDFHQIEVIKYNGRPLRLVSDILGPKHRAGRSAETNSYIVNESSLYNSNFVGNVGGVYSTGNTPTYSQQGRTIRTSFPEGTIWIKYIARKLDEDCWPMIPDQIDFKEAVLRYIVYKMMYSKFIMGTISPNVYEKVEIDWWRYVKQARATAIMPNLDMLENISRNYLSLKPNPNQYKNFFHDLNQSGGGGNDYSGSNRLY